MTTVSLAARDTTMPQGKWAFDDDVTRVFDDMLARSIPQYDAMRDIVYKLACKYRQPQTDIVDLGCSHGRALEPLVARFGETNRYFGCDVSEPMLAQARALFAGNERVHIERVDLRNDYPLVYASVTLLIFTAQFVPIEYRQRLLAQVYAHTVRGGAVIIAEKVLGASADVNDALIGVYYDLKRANGYTDEQIERKRLSLEGVLVPLTARANESMLADAGFAQVDCFWRWANFGAWLGVRP